jgi:hypothetical protein
MIAGLPAPILVYGGGHAAEARAQWPAPAPRLPPPFQVTNAMRDILPASLPAVADQVVGDQSRTRALLADEAEIRAEP